ncbi:CPBP family intramembrane glutamic endopeptidase [Streptomyces sp. NPDC093109]|uniref:CPBP family intramembrane glutamic endopeptidase n=1 Tax=Streptomyces sp. NPDC093109 TaxID=3154977 RepID=UPI00344CA91F
MSLVNPLVQLSFAFLPAIAAVVVRRWVTREGFADAGLALRLRHAWPYYLMAWLTPLLIAAGALAFAAVAGLWRPDLSPLDGLVPGLPGWAGVLLLMCVVPLLTPLYWGEEFGWTSYLRPRVYPGRMVPSVLVTGVVWAVWHYPLAFLGYIEFGNVLLGLAVWTVSFLFQEILLCWLYLRSGTIWTASLAHAGNNMVLSLLLSVVVGDGGGGGDGGGVGGGGSSRFDTTTLTWLPVIPMALLCLVCVRFWNARGKDLREKSPACVDAGVSRST